jgi:hypothetical protein
MSVEETVTTAKSDEGLPKWLAVLLVVSCFTGLGLMAWHWSRPGLVIRTLELSGWDRNDAPSGLLRESIRQAATDWTPYSGLILLAAGGLLGSIVFAGPLARRLSNASTWVLLLLALVHVLEYRLLFLLTAPGDAPLRTYGFWLQGAAFLGYALTPIAAIVAVLGALTAVSRLAVNLLDDKESKKSNSNPRADDIVGPWSIEGDVTGGDFAREALDGQHDGQIRGRSVGHHLVGHFDGHLDQQGFHGHIDGDFNGPFEGKFKDGHFEGHIEGQLDGKAISGDTAHWHRSLGLPRKRKFGELGICLSGGGIRSASFSLGALQSLQRKPALSGDGKVCELMRARYLAAVSGGGYTAGALLLAVHPEETVSEGSNKPSASPEGRQEVPKEAALSFERVFRAGSDEFDYLRRHCSYIADGIREWSTAILVVLRGALLSTLLLSLIALVAGRWAGHLYNAFGRANDLTGPWHAVWGADFAVLGVAVLAVLLWLVADLLGLGNHRAARARVAEAAWMAWMAFAVLVVLGAAVPIVTGASMQIAHFAGGQGPNGSVVGGAFKGGLFGLLGVITTILGLLNRQRANVLNTVREGKGALEKVLGDTGSRIVRGLPVVVGLGMVLAVYLVIFGCSTFYAATVGPGVNPMVTWGLPHWRLPVSNLGLTTALTLLLIVLYMTSDETAMGLHPFYRRRLASAFAVRRVWQPPQDKTQTGEFRAQPYSYDEATPIEDYGQPLNGGQPKRENQAKGDDQTKSVQPPLMAPQVIFCASAHCSDPDQTPPGRKVLPFSFSFDAIGGPEVGWCSPQRMRRGVGGKSLGKCLTADLTVEAAMAVSGAAFASASGSGRVPANMIMGLMNARLGTWIANPSYFGQDPPHWWRARPPRIRRLSYMLREIFGIHPFDFPMLFVTDGAHHESLGLVELLRHRCAEIYCFDASSDSETFASSIARAITLAYNELGITVKLQDPDKADPRRSGANDDSDELKHRIAEKPIVAGTVTYPGLPGVEAQTGVLVIGRATLYDDMPWEIRRHAAAHPMFPNDATGDQWFDEGKFNAYTYLGRCVGTLAFNEMKKKLQEAPPDIRRAPRLSPADHSLVGVEAGDGHRPQKARP